jgi:Protein of unknown function (DUF2630)
MDDQQVLAAITRLTDEEGDLERSHRDEPLTEEKLERLEAVRVSLDQCWDLLRQRRARRDAGLDPDAAAARSSDVVEGYLQ